MANPPLATTLILLALLSFSGCGCWPSGGDDAAGGETASSDPGPSPDDAQTSEPEDSTSAPAAAPRPPAQAAGAPAGFSPDGIAPEPQGLAGGSNAAGRDEALGRVLDWALSGSLVLPDGDVGARLADAEVPPVEGAPVRRHRDPASALRPALPKAEAAAARIRRWDEKLLDFMRRKGVPVESVSFSPAGAHPRVLRVSLRGDADGRRDVALAYGVLRLAATETAPLRRYTWKIGVAGRPWALGPG